MMNGHDYDDEDYSFEGEDDEEADTTAGYVWNLLRLINPGDEENALRQFASYRDAVPEDEDDPQARLGALKDAIDWVSGFHVEAHDVEALIDSINELAARWDIRIDWGGDPSDGDFLEQTDVPALMALAYDRLRESGYTLWTWNTGIDAHAGWIALSRDDDAMLELGALLGIEMRPGSDAF